ncbi:NrdR family transcriptional regulator [Streptomyces cyaneofuscatus]|uniref:NrdR family transcriptional regulator n=1 Tax=Streptomyces cyaneofuscatus TaxID=66883 RepID=UPI003F52C23A
MRCPECQGDTSVVSVHASEDGTSITRRRSCSPCGTTFSTLETAVLVYVGPSLVFDPFSRSEIIRRVRTAAQQQVPIEDALADARRSKQSANPVVAAQLCPLVSRSNDLSAVEAYLCLPPLELASGRGGVSANAVSC